MFHEPASGVQKEGGELAGGPGNPSDLYMKVGIKSRRLLEVGRGIHESAHHCDQP